MNNVILAEIIRHALQSVPDQVELDLCRTAYSPLVFEYKDFAIGITDPQGRLICQSRGGIPAFIANVLGLAVREVLALHPVEELAPGDAFISNDPETFGQHLNNVVMTVPVFIESRLFGFVAILVHWIDVGGRYVGSANSNDSTDIFQEGIQLPCLHIRRRGKPVAEIYRLVTHNSRFPKALRGDLDAQVAGCLKGVQLLSDVVGRYGEESVSLAIGTMWAKSEAASRSAVAAMPDGRYEAHAFLDDDGVTAGRPIEIGVAVEVSGERLTVDLSNISPQLAGPYNSGREGGGVTAARVAFKYLVAPDEPANEGVFAPLDVVLPDGTFLSAGKNAPLARYSSPLPTVIDVILKAMASVLPDRVPAGHHANMGSHRFRGRHPQTGALFSHLDTVHGGWGACAGQDGAGPFKTLAHGDTLDVPVEVQEALYPLRVGRYELRPDSGGAGRWRGGLGTRKTYHVEASCQLTVSFERFGCLPWGLFGGGDGARGGIAIRHGGGKPVAYRKQTEIELSAGDEVLIDAGGGGGFGDPHERDRAALNEDLRNGYVTAEAAASQYGARQLETTLSATTAGQPGLADLDTR